MVFHIWYKFSLLLGIHHCDVSMNDHIWNRIFVRFFCLWTHVFGLLFWFDFNSLICSCNDLSFIYSNCSFFSRFLISLIILQSSTTPVCSSNSSKKFPLLTTSSRDTIELVKQNLHNFWEWVPNINCVFMCLSSFSKLHLLAIDLRRLQNCCTVSSLSSIVFWNLYISKCLWFSGLNVYSNIQRLRYNPLL